jgi:sporulation protein YlmC with PRC-barrel domain
MKASDLIGADVRDADGRPLGAVTDIRCVQDGPLRGAMAAPRVIGLLVSRHHAGSLLGYDRRAQQGPWLIRVIVGALHRRTVEVPWSAVESYQDGVLLRVGAAELDRP